MSRRPSPLKPLEGAQADASHPEKLVWLSASAGTGKTHVLTARVIRLLLAGNDPAAILCLTFTKAGAAEMADRIHARLASWVRMKEPALRKELFALGERHDDAAVREARTLFARVLEATGGGLRIQTIHAFCQTLLAGFPSEGGLIPGFRPLDEREEQALGRATLAELLVAAEGGGDLPLIRDVQALSRRLGEQGAEGFLRQCARAPDAMAALGPGIEPRLRREMGVPDGDVEQAIAEACTDDRFDRRTLESIAAANAGWGTKNGLERADIIARWLVVAPAERARTLDLLHAVWATAKGDPRSFNKGQAPQEPGYADMAMRMHGACADLLALRAKAAFASIAAAGLRAGQAYARAYVEAKRAAGAVDFDDLIRAAVRLLGTPGIGDWVRFKLDQRTDHILVDEAQDTNAQQWAIVGALADEFWRVAAEPGDRVRTLFTVGDFKQAIFGFQGTDPLYFEAAARGFSNKAEEAERLFDALSLDRSFRSTPPVLAVVDRLIGHLGHAAFGLFDEVPPHQSAKRGPGRVELWPPVIAGEAEDVAGGEEGWLDDATRIFADNVAQQVKRWLAEAPWVSTKERTLRPEDIMILVRKRGDLASLLVARLHAHGVPVAGVDRLRLDAPLAVKDLLAAARFALQPDDDLNLASLLVSPLFGWSQDELYAVAYPRKAWTPLWPAIPAGDARDRLRTILAAADLVTPYRFFEELLSGPLDARRKLLLRLGEEARDPIEELLNAALLFEEEGSPSLQLFLDWFDRGEVQIKRDPSAPMDAVRVMTAHGSKGLQAPLVVLADATGDPDRSPLGGIAWTTEGGDVPIVRPRKEERFDPFDTVIAKAETRALEEHWRLLYVAATRAEEWLAIGGALGPAARGVVPPNSWHAALGLALDGMATETVTDPIWGEVRVYAETGERGRARPPRAVAPSSALPGWLHEPAPEEARPPRPLAPSAIGLDTVANPPPTPAMRAAAERGRWLHALFERLPSLPPEQREAAALRWLERSAGIADAGLRAALVADACAIIADPRFAAIFSPAALAEAPIAAVVDGQVIAGTVDRLLVEDDRVTIVDFKTGRRVPSGLAAVPRHHLDQMGAYAAALAEIFPGRTIEAALLYTAGPSLVPLGADILAAHKPRLEGSEQSLPVAG